MRVHQLLCAAGPVDAVTQQGLACRRLFSGWGWDGQDYAEVLAPDMDRRVIRRGRELEPDSHDALLIHYSGYAPGIERVVEMPSPTLLISHNITPARFFWALEPVEGVRCALAPTQLADLARRVKVAAGVSEYNAADLRAAGATNVQVIPILFQRERLGDPGPDPPPGPPTIMFVGRLAPHKRQDLIIRAFGLYRRERAPDARLVLVGVASSPRFERALRQLAAEVAPSAVTIESAIPAERLWEHYRSAHAFVCLSEHEGFCIPLLEAFHFGVPVVARPAAGIPEVAGDAALLVEPDDLAVIAELIHLAVTDRELRAELARRAQMRLDSYAYERTAQRLRDTLEGLVAA
ncbi:MAG TPA: glycosyltransferase [Solirubrobacteraceae bacterium]|nr:glycosyltransferase [Solirubrobacteraceae bacterium]